MIDDSMISRLLAQTQIPITAGVGEKCHVLPHKQLQALAKACFLAGVEEGNTDPARIDWLREHLFDSTWNGVIDSGSRTHWRMTGPYRHILQTFEGVDFRDAIDKVREAWTLQSSLIPR